MKSFVLVRKWIFCKIQEWYLREKTFFSGVSLDISVKYMGNLSEMDNSYVNVIIL